MLDAIRTSAIPLSGGGDDYEWLPAVVGDARFVLIGDASHGTHEFYRERAEITRLLIEDLGFTGVALEANWTDAWRVNEYVRGLGNDSTAEEALGGFSHWPTWMWRNTDVAAFVEWLRDRNDGVRDPADDAGVYGLDLYGLGESAQAVLAHLEAIDADAAAIAASRYACFELDVASDVSFPDVDPAAARDCADGASLQFDELAREVTPLAGICTSVQGGESFNALQNARVVEAAARYFGGLEVEPLWNVRDRHMAASLESLAECLDTTARPSRIVVWAHNSHVGDQRAMEIGTAEHVSLGQLVREAYPDETVLIGSSTYGGTVLAADDWEAEAHEIDVRPALRESYEWLFHAATPSVGRDFALLLDKAGATTVLAEPRLQRAIGVLYLANTERSSHYYEARLAEQFDVVLHFDTTRALDPLHPGTRPET